MISKLSVLMLAAVMVFGQSCSFYETMVSGTKVGAAERLWEGIPQIEGATKIDTPLPPYARRHVEGMQIENLYYVAYSTSRTVAEVESIYSKEKMANAGWGSASQCLGGSTGSRISDGAVCIYFRPPDSALKYPMLAIYAIEDPKKKETLVFYIKFELDPKKLLED